MVSATPGIFGQVEEDDMVVLTPDTIDAFLSENEHSYVLFYSHWCVISKRRLNMHHRVAKHMKELDPPVPFAKIDIGIYDHIAKKYNIKMPPVLKWFHRGESVDYDGEHDEVDLYDYVVDNANPVTWEITDTEELEHFKITNRVLVVYSGPEEGENYKNFHDVAVTTKGVHFAHIHKHDKVFAPGIHMFKHFDEMYHLHTGDYSKKSIKDFIHKHKFETVMQFVDDFAIDRVFGRN